MKGDSGRVQRYSPICFLSKSEILASHLEHRFVEMTFRRFMSPGTVHNKSGFALGSLA
jgi:hypothetical protein